MMSAALLRVGVAIGVIYLRVWGLGSGFGVWGLGAFTYQNLLFLKSP